MKNKERIWTKFHWLYFQPINLSVIGRQKLKKKPPEFSGGSNFYFAESAGAVFVVGAGEVVGAGWFGTSV